MMKSFWKNLDTRQRYIAIFGIVCVVLALALKFVVFPLWDAKARMKKSIASSAGKQEELIRLDAELGAQTAKIAQIKQALAMRRPDFTLFSYLEKKAQAANVKGNVKQMNSVPGQKSPAFEEALVDMKIEKITIRQLTDFLQQVELPAEMIKIKRITISKMKESPEYLSVQLLVASYTPVTARPGGP